MIFLMNWQIFGSANRNSLFTIQSAFLLRLYELLMLFVKTINREREREWEGVVSEGASTEDTM